jgi:hypothetical protein
VADRQADAKFEQETVHLVTGLRAVAHQRLADPVQADRVCCDSVFGVTNRMDGRAAASQIASASTKSFLLLLTKGRTNCGEMSLT